VLESGTACKDLVLASIGLLSFNGKDNRWLAKLSPIKCT
jgi:hypothetical protein